MAVLGGIAGSENRLTSFFERTKTLLAEAKQSISVFSSAGHGDIDRIEMLHERLSEAGETVFILRERRGERASELISSDRDLEKANFHRNINELSTRLTRLRVYFENMADYLNEDTVNVPAHQCMRGQLKLEVSKGKIQFLHRSAVPAGSCSRIISLTFHLCTRIPLLCNAPNIRV